MSTSLPTGVRALLGLAAIAVEEVRKLPETLPTAITTVPVGALSNAMQASLKFQQQLAMLAAKGDEVISQFKSTPSEAPAWATFDEDEPAADSRPKAAFERIDYEDTGFGEAADEAGGWDAVGPPGVDEDGIGEPEVGEPEVGEPEVAEPEVAETEVAETAYKAARAKKKLAPAVEPAPFKPAPADEAPAKKATVAKATAAKAAATKAPAKKATARKSPAKKTPAAPSLAESVLPDAEPDVPGIGLNLAGPAVAQSPAGPAVPGS